MNLETFDLSINGQTLNNIQDNTPMIDIIDEMGFDKEEVQVFLGIAFLGIAFLGFE